MTTTLGPAGLLVRNECLGTEMQVTGVRGYFTYANGVKSNVIEGYKYTVVLPERNFASLDVKIPGQ